MSCFRWNNYCSVGSHVAPCIFILFLIAPFNYANTDEDGLTHFSPGGEGSSSICQSCKMKGRGIPSGESGILLMKEGPRDPEVSPPCFVLINSPTVCYSASQSHLGCCTNPLSPQPIWRLALMSFLGSAPTNFSDVPLFVRFHPTYLFGDAWVLSKAHTVILPETPPAAPWTISPFPTQLMGRRG